MKVATVQMAPVFQDRDHNLKRMLQLAEEASRAGAKLIVFPELTTTGYSYMSPDDAGMIAEVIGKQAGSTFLVMSTAAQTMGAALVWGMIERDAGTGDLYNSQVLVTPEGQYIAYRKINLWGQDLIWATEGKTNPPVIPLTLGGVTRKVGLLICRDVRDKKDDNWKSFYEPGDADIVCLGANWGDGGFPAIGWVEFAKDNKTTLIVSNRYGQEANNNFGEGGSCVIEPTGRIHCEGLRWSQDCIVYAEVP